MAVAATVLVLRVWWVTDFAKKKSLVWQKGPCVPWSCSTVAMSSPFCPLRARLLPANKLPVCRLLALGLFSLFVIVAPQRIGELREAVAQAGIDAAGFKVLLTQWLELRHQPSQLLDDMRRLKVRRERHPLFGWHVLDSMRARVDMGAIHGHPR